MATEPGATVVESATSSRTWADLINERFVPLRITPTASADLAGSVRTRTLAHLQASSVSSIPQTFTRSRSLLHCGRELLAVGLVDRGRGYLEQDGRHCEVSSGAFAFYDTSRPFTWAMDGDWRLHVFTWPRESLGMDQADLARVTAVRVPGKDGVGAFIGPMFAQVAGRASFTLRSTLAGRLADELAEMAVTAALEQLVDDSADTAGDALLQQIQCFVEDSLSDPDLTPDTIAATFFISTRTLHRMFARQGITVAAWIKSRRLDLARRLLAQDRHALPIREIAYRAGFSNAAFFSREFASRFGATPRQYRSQHSSS